MIKQKKGYFFTIDALVAIIIIIGFLFLFNPTPKLASPEVETHFDTLEVMSGLSIQEYAQKKSDEGNNYWKNLIQDKTIKNLNYTLLEQLVEFYALGDTTNLNLLSEDVFDDLSYDGNIGLWFEDELIYLRNNAPYEDSNEIHVARQITTGMKKPVTGGNVTGFMVHAKLSKSLDSEYFYFGGFVGQGNITAKMHYEGIINQSYFEGVVSDDFDLYVSQDDQNWVQLSKSCNGNPGETAPIKCDISTENFQSGDNYLKFVASNSENQINFSIQGGYIRILYNSTNDYQQKTKFYLPGIEGLINLYDSFYVPADELNEVSLYLRYNNSFDNFFNIGGITIFNDTSETITETTLTSSEILDKLEEYDYNYENLTKKTIPIRYGLENASYITNLTNFVDVVSVTDLSGSMDDNCGSCSEYTCSQPACHDSDGCKICDAKDANDNLIDIILDLGGNKIGLVGYRTSVSDSDCHELSDDTSLLKNEVSSWYADGGTCICCGINKAVAELTTATYQQTKEQAVYYNFNNDVQDKSGNNNHGIINGDPTYVSGLEGQSLDFNGNDYVEVPDLINTNEGTVSFWVKPNQWRYQTILDAANGGSSGDQYFFVDVDSGRDLRFHHEDADDSDFQDAEYPMDSYSSNEWHHVSIIWRYEGSPSAELYLDGTLIDVDNSNADSLPDFDSIYLGNNKFSYGTYWDFEGEIDEFRIYNEALSINEIIGLNTTDSVCGNDITEVGEVCDDNYLLCEQEGFEGTRQCNSQCDGYLSCDTVGECGDGFKNQGEECDDGNLENDDGCSSECEIEDRAKVIIVMSDGHATHYCDNFEDFTGSGNSYSSQIDKDTAIAAACNAYENHEIVVHAVGFGSGVDDETLQAIADCGNGEYYYADVGEIADLYDEIAKDIIATYSEQTIGVIQTDVSTYLSPDSYIELDYPHLTRPYGEIITAETLPFGNNLTLGTFELPSAEEYLEANVISYSGDLWTDKVDFKTTNWKEVFRLEDFLLLGQSYINLGDPYVVNINASLISSGTNQINISSGGSQYSEPPENRRGSEYDKAIVTMRKNFTALSPVRDRAVGCVWNITFSDGSSQIFPVYYGDNPEPLPSPTCEYSPNVQNYFEYDSGDAVQYAVAELLTHLDFNNNGKVDVRFDGSDLRIEPIAWEGIPFTWATEVQIRVWS